MVSYAAQLKPIPVTKKVDTISVSDTVGLRFAMRFVKNSRAIPKGETEDELTLIPLPTPVRVRPRWQPRETS